MKVFSIVVSALAGLVAAAPAAHQERPRSIDLSAINGLQFANTDLAYFGVTNKDVLDLQLLAQLSDVNQFDLGVAGIQNLFVQDVFNVNQLLQLQALAAFQQIAALGVLNNFNLGTLNLNILDLGLFSDSFGGLDLTSFLDSSFSAEVKAVASKQVVVSI